MTIILIVKLIVKPNRFLAKTLFMLFTPDFPMAAMHQRNHDFDRGQNLGVTAYISHLCHNEIAKSLMIIMIS